MSKDYKGYAGTGPVIGVGWLVAKLMERHRRRQAKTDADAIENLRRLHDLKAQGVITEEEFRELKEKIKQKI